MPPFKEIVTFIRSLYPGKGAVIPLHEPFFDAREKQYLNECIDSTYVSSVGPFVDRFEELTKAYTGAGSAVVCVNGTAALHIALQLAGVRQGDEVITQPLTFIATANAISYIGAHPVFVDVSRHTLGLSPRALKAFLQAHAEKKEGGTFNKATGNKITACLPMHTFGLPCEIEDIIAICNEWGIPVIEDAAESLGSFYHNRHTGRFGKIGVFSYNGNKTITTGGGGMLITDDERLGALAKHLTTQAKVPHKWEYIHDMTGYNYRMPNINAALGVAQMEKLEAIVENKRVTAQKYASFFKENNITFITEPEQTRANYWLNAIVLKDREERDAFLAYTNSCGVMTRPVWRLMNELPMFASCMAGNLENAVWLSQRLVNIPSSVTL